MIRAARPLRAPRAVPFRAHEGAPRHHRDGPRQVRAEARTGTGVGRVARRGARVLQAPCRLPLRELLGAEPAGARALPRGFRGRLRVLPLGRRSRRRVGLAGPRARAARVVARRARGARCGRGAAPGVRGAARELRALRARGRAVRRPHLGVRARPDQGALRDLGRGARLLPPERESRRAHRAARARRALRRRAARRERRALHGAAAHQPLAGHPPRLDRARTHLHPGRHARHRRLRVAPRGHDRAGVLRRPRVLGRVAAAGAAPGRAHLGRLRRRRAAGRGRVARGAAAALAVRGRRPHGALEHRALELRDRARAAQAERAA